MIVHYSFLDHRLQEILSLPGRKIIVYHNITPGHFFRALGQAGLADGCDVGRAQLGGMAAGFDAAVGVSAFNAAELIERGYATPRVIPVFYDDHFFADGGVSAQAFLDRRLSGEVNLVCIGRIVPNKRPDNLIRVLAILKKMLRRPVRLRWHGKVFDRSYLISLRRLAEDLGVEHEVSFEINQPPEALRASLAAADCFVSVSEHEGFMVPLLEAFSAACPVVALDTTAVGETCGSAACLIRDPDLELIAAHIANIHADRDLRLALIRAQSRRAQDFSRRRTLAKWDDLLRDFLPTPW
jgi:glycosyltransferase involved in cell wall biosynthesis